MTLSSILKKKKTQLEEISEKIDSLLIIRKRLNILVVRNNSSKFKNKLYSKYKNKDNIKIRIIESIEGINNSEYGIIVL